MTPGHEGWDAIVVGTGMGGATLGHALAAAGQRVLFIEKGIVDRSGIGGIRGMYPESSPGFNKLDMAQRHERLLEAGRSIDEVESARTFIPFIGTGGGGSTALFGMAMERFFAQDFTPRANYRDADSTLPEAWPVSYAEMAPWYAKAETLFRVSGAPDPLRAGDNPPLRTPPVFSAPNEALADVLQRQGLHPYALHLACDDVPACATCQGVLCPRGCKRDAATTCLLPALREHGAQVLDRTSAVGLEADHTRVTGVIVERAGAREVLRGRHVVLAAGALMTPALLLNSTSRAWPGGVGNKSDQVGRNLMRHAIELVFLRGGSRLRDGERSKQISLSDFYLAGERSEGRKLGTLQSLGALPSAADLLGHMSPLLHAIARPLMRIIWQDRIRRINVLAAIMEDLPQAANRITPGAPFSDGARQRVRMHYRLSAQDLDRVATFRRVVGRALAPLRPRAIALAKHNSAIAHACGTCRFGTDPATSVLDANNRAHGLDNLYVVDASFFPSSSGTNPSLTIAANALRVAAHLNARF